ncbi:MAG: serine hydrolase domain-containing protein [Beijerinckiaceae bacterium]
MKRTLAIGISAVLAAAILLAPANVALAQSQVEEALKVPGAKPVLPVSAARKPFDNAFIAEARKYWGNFHWQMGGDHALYYNTHLSEFMPMAVAPPVGDVSRLRRSPVASVKKTVFVHADGSQAIPLDEYVTNGKMRAQAVMILHRGKVVYEAYPGLDPAQPHFWASVTKSTVGLLASMLEEQGLIDVNRPVTAYAKQLAGSQWDKVRVIDALNMAVGLDIQEDLKALTDPMSMFQRFGAAELGVPNGNGVVETPLDVLRAAKPIAGEAPGMPSRYSTLTTKVLVYVIEGATSRSFTDLYGEKVWSKIGARQPFMVGVGPDGVAGAYGLGYSTLEDLARYALVFTPSWKAVSKSEVVSPRVLKALQTSGDHKAYLAGDWTRGWVGDVFGKDMPVFNSRQFDAVWADGAMFKHGNLYQGIYVDPMRDVVGVFFSTVPMTGSADLLPGYIRQAAKNLAGK